MFSIYREILRYCETFIPKKRFVKKELRYDMFHYMAYLSRKGVVDRKFMIRCDAFTSGDDDANFPDKVDFNRLGICFHPKTEFVIGSYCILDKQLGQIENIQGEEISAVSYTVRFYATKKSKTCLLTDLFAVNNFTDIERKFQTRNVYESHFNFRQALLSNILQMVQQQKYERFDIRHLNKKYNFFYGIVYDQNSIESTTGSTDDIYCSSLFVGIKELAIPIPISIKGYNNVTTHSRIAEIGVFSNGKHVFGKTICVPVQKKYIVKEVVVVVVDTTEKEDEDDAYLKEVKVPLHLRDNLFGIKWYDHIESIRSEKWIRHKNDDYDDGDDDDDGLDDTDDDIITKEIHQRIKKTIFAALSNPEKSIHKKEDGDKLNAYKVGQEVFHRRGYYREWFPAIVHKIRIDSTTKMVTNVDIKYHHNGEIISNIAVDNTNLEAVRPKYTYFGISSHPTDHTYSWGLFSTWDSTDSGKCILHNGFRLHFNVTTIKFDVHLVFDGLYIPLNQKGILLETDEKIETLTELQVEEKIVRDLFDQDWRQVQNNGNKLPFQQLLRKINNSQTTQMRDAFAQKMVSKAWLPFYSNPTSSTEDLGTIIHPTVILNNMLEDHKVLTY